MTDREAIQLELFDLAEVRRRQPAYVRYWARVADRLVADWWAEMEAVEEGLRPQPREDHGVGLVAGSLGETVEDPESFV